MATKAKKKEEVTEEAVKWPFGPRNYMVFGAAMASIILGYISLGKGSITLAPILLVLGYCVLVPIALIIKGKPEEDQGEASDSKS